MSIPPVYQTSYRAGVFNLNSNSDVAKVDRNASQATEIETDINKKKRVRRDNSGLATQPYTAWNSYTGYWIKRKKKPESKAVRFQL